MKIIINVHNTENINLEKLIQKTKRNIIHRSGVELTSIIKKTTPKDSGHLHSSWHMEEEKGATITFTNSAKYAKWVNEGTGIYGPRKQRIYPKNGRVLVFKPGRKYKGKYGPVPRKGKFRGKYVFPSIRGQKGQHYLEKSSKKLQSKLPSIIRNSLNDATKGM
ncbi:HK97 gp10 family phage protein [Methanosphaera sp.]|uniref:HK97 gp10 family phage protein n=1 Tax=Methanosphaera sp. TaxID=2666342 RepID=UPI003D8E2D2C